jgi:hypothetical protein
MIWGVVLRRRTLEVQSFACEFPWWGTAEITITDYGVWGASAGTVGAERI